MGLNNAKGYYLAETRWVSDETILSKVTNETDVSIFRHCFFFLIQKTLEFCIAGEGEEKSNHYSGET